MISQMESTNQKASSPETPWNLFWTVFLFQLLLIWLLQVESYFHYVYNVEDSVSDGLLFLARLPLIQFESFLFALLLGGLAFVFFRPFFLRWIYCGLVFCCTTLILLDQVYYKIFFDHIRMSMTEDRAQDTGKVLMPLLDSFYNEIDPSFLLNIVFAIALFHLLHKHRKSLSNFLRQLSCKPKGLMIFPAIFIFANIGVYIFSNTRLNVGVLYAENQNEGERFSFFSKNHNLDQHPIFTLLASAIFPHKPFVPPNIELVKDLATLRFGTYLENQKDTKKLESFVRAVQSRKKLPNILFITLESVGGIQIFEKGKISPKKTPQLSKLAKQSIVFPHVYTTFPGTARAHITLNAGGRTPTWSSVYEDTVYPYQGPVLVRELAKKGYQTAFFCCQFTNVEGFDEFYKRLGFETYFTYSTAPEKFRAKYKLNYWGAREDGVVKETLKWLDKRNSSKPFFLNFVSVATHHPYGVPEGYKGPYPGNENEEKYYNSLHFIDAALGELMDGLKKRGLLKDTLIALTGDHGEAFGKRHRRNFTHKHYLYEENIVTFLWIIDPTKIQQGPFYSTRLGSIGDIMPTLLHLVKAQKVDVPGLNLLADQYKLPLIFFHKSAYPERWGLRDGKWKFIIRNNKEEAQIFDIEKDPQEQKNLASQYRARIDQYYNLCASWLLKKTPEYRKYLKGFKQFGNKITAQDLTFSGPKVLAIGRFPNKSDMDNFKNFVEMKKVNPQEKIGAWGRWQPYDMDVPILYRITSPSKKVFKRYFKMRPGWAITWLPFGLPLPMEEGKWQVHLQETGAKTDKKFMVKIFEVDQKVKLRYEK